jgi:hypothetical protein
MTHALNASTWAHFAQTQPKPLTTLPCRFAAWGRLSTPGAPFLPLLPGRPPPPPLPAGRSAAQGEFVATLADSLRRELELMPDQKVAGHSAHCPLCLVVPAERCVGPPWQRQAWRNTHVCACSCRGMNWRGGPIPRAASSGMSQLKAGRQRHLLRPHQHLLRAVSPSIWRHCDSAGSCPCCPMYVSMYVQAELLSLMPGSLVAVFLVTLPTNSTSSSGLAEALDTRLRSLSSRAPSNVSLLVPPSTAAKFGITGVFCVCFVCVCCV